MSTEKPSTKTLLKLDVTSRSGSSYDTRSHSGTNSPIQEVGNNVESLESILKLGKIAKDILNSRLDDLLEKTTETLRRVREESVVTKSFIDQIKGIPDEGNVSVQII